MAVYDEDGQELARNNNTASNYSLTFNLEENDVDAALVVWTNDREVQLYYSAQRSPLPSNSTGGPQETSAGVVTVEASAVLNKLWLLWGFILAFLVVFS
jgi:hypothetical protein